MNDLPLELLRTFLATVDTGSMANAARQVARTPSAVSLQMSRLGELVGQPLFRRSGRAQALTHAGELLVPHAREILGASERALAPAGAAWGGRARARAACARGARGRRGARGGRRARRGPRPAPPPPPPPPGRGPGRRPPARRSGGGGWRRAGAGFSLPFTD